MIDPTHTCREEGEGRETDLKIHQNIFYVMELLVILNFDTSVGVLQFSTINV